MEKSLALHLNKIESHLHKDAFFQVWLKLAQSSGEEEENLKSLQQRRQRQLQRWTTDKL